MMDCQVYQTSGRIITAPWWQAHAARLAKKLRLPGSCQVSLAIVGTTTMRRLNLAYHDSDTVTDVLSFAERDVVKRNHRQWPVSPNAYLGEVIICYPRAVVQARRYGHTLRQELELLWIHGLLHLLGYDHANPRQTAAMRQVEMSVLTVPISRI